MLADDDARLNEASDMRTGQAPDLLQLDSPNTTGLAALQSRWAEMPMIPKVVHDRHQGIDNSWPGFDLRTLLVGEESAGRFTVHDVIVAPAARLPPHHVTTSDTYLCVLDGELDLTVGGRTEVTRTDGFAYVPENTTFALHNRSALPARIFLWHAPAGPERAFAAAHRLSSERPDAKPEDFYVALASLGFVFHEDGESLSNDRRTNERGARLKMRVETFDDFAALRQTWAHQAPTPKLVQDRSVERDIAVPGQDTKVLLSGEESGARAVVMHYGIMPGYRAPEHHQPSEEEIFLVLEGALDLRVGNVTTELGRGGFGFAPRYATHGFSNPASQGQARTITINSPAGHERAFEMVVREGLSERLPDLLVAHGWRFHLAAQAD